MVLFLAIINNISATSGSEPRFHVAAESELAVGPIWRCSRAWNCRDFLYFHLEVNSNWLMMRKLLLQLVPGPTVKCLDNDDYLLFQQSVIVSTIPRSSV